MTGRVESLAYTRDGRALLTVSGGAELAELFDAWQGKPVEIKQQRPRRSLDANAYCWVLLDKLAAKLGRTKAEIYREAIRSIGGVSETVCVRDIAVDKLIEGWQHNGLGWFADKMPSKLKGCTNVVLYYGSSTYDTKQMSALIDAIIQDCKAVGVETLRPEQIAALNAAWGGKHE
jgi:hypothetical protein